MRPLKAQTNYNYCVLNSRENISNFDDNLMTREKIQRDKNKMKRNSPVTPWYIGDALNPLKL